MAYYLYKKVQDKKRNSGEEHLLNQYPGPQNQNEAPAGAISTTDETGKLQNEREDSLRRKEAARAARKYRWRLIGGLFLPATVQGLNTTLIAGALPFIASDFHQFAQINWIITAYNLTAAAFIPVWGQFADIFGRYITLQASLGFVIFGSALCAGAPVTAFPMLLAGRGLEGVGVAGLIILMKIILADKVSLKENAKNNTIFTIVYGVGFSVGPVIGGLLTAVSWRWCFIINIPLAVAGLVVAHFLTRPVLLGPQDLVGHENMTRISSSDRFLRRLSTIDFGGQLIFLFGMGLLVLALTWAGSYYAWSDVKVIAPLVVGVALMIAFLSWEYLLLPGHWLATRFPHRQAMVSLKLLWTRNAGLLMYINFITGMAMFAVFYFVDLYFTIVQNFDSGKAGVSLIYYTPGLGAGAYMAMFCCNVWPRKTWPPLAFGTVIEALGITLLAAALGWGHLPTVYGMLALTGVGTGIRLMPGTLHGVAFVKARQIASIVALMNLAVSLGGTIASTVMLNIFQSRLARAGITVKHGTSSSVSSFSAISNLAPKEQEYLRSKASDGIVVAFYSISSFMWLGVVAVLFLGNANIQKRSKDNTPDEYELSNAEILTDGSYIGSLFRPYKAVEREQV